MPYLIQGLFFQDRLELGVNYRPGQGTIAVIGAILEKYLFSGAFWEEGGQLKGMIQDAFGVAAITNISVDDGGISFRKIYQGRRDHIQYHFTKRDGASWVGEYDGLLTGNGIARCVVTEVPEAFFDPIAIMAALGRDNAFDAPPLDGSGPAS